jgi:hypothetical protein
MADSRPSKSKFESDEDTRLIEAVRIFGTTDWWLVASAVPNRTARQCRERWSNYLNPTLNSNAWTEAEDRLLFEKVEQLGCRWNVIVNFFDGRSKNSLRNRYRSAQRQTSRIHAPQCANPISPNPNPEPLAPVIEDPFAFLDRIEQEWNFSWHEDCDTFFL